MEVEDEDGAATAVVTFLLTVGHLASNKDGLSVGHILAMDVCRKRNVKYMGHNYTSALWQYKSLHCL